MALHRARESLPPRMAVGHLAARATASPGGARSASPAAASASEASKGQQEKLLELETILDSLYEFLPALVPPGQQLANAERVVQQATDALRAQVRLVAQHCVV